MRLILDVGSGNSLPDCDTVVRLVDAIKRVDTGKHEIILKSQLFENAPPNTPIRNVVFEYLYYYGSKLGYQVTASVFDKNSLAYLLQFHPLPFVKIACRPDLYWLAGEIKRDMPIYISCSDRLPKDYSNTVKLLCVSKYPAEEKEYSHKIFIHTEAQGISDHTVGWGMYKSWNKLWAMKYWEKHIVLNRDRDNPDSGAFAILPDDLKEIM